MARFKSAIPWVLLGLVVVALVWSYAAPRLAGGEDHEARRWKSGGTVAEQPAFTHLAKPATDPAPPAQDGPIAPKVPDWTLPHVAVYSVPTINPPHPYPTLRDLSESGQAHAIDFLSQNAPSAPHAWSDLQKAMTSEGDTAWKDPFRFDRVLVATIAKGAGWEPGDRMMWTRVFVQPINFRFAGYSVAATENETVRINSVEATQDRKVSTDIGLTIPGLQGSKADAASSNESTVKRTADINAQYERLGVDIMPTFLRIIRESETGGDVVGNTTVSLSILTDAKMIWRKFPTDKSERPLGDDVVLIVAGMHLYDGATELSPDDASLTVLPQTPLPHCALRARVWMLYEERHITAGREFYDESRQTVEFVRDADGKQDIDLVEADDVSPAVWSIQILSKTAAAGSADAAPVFLSGRVDGGVPRELVFTDYGQASSFAHWIRTHPNAKIHGLAFNYDDGNSVVPVKKKGDECSPNYDRGKSSVIDKAVLKGP